MLIYDVNSGTSGRINDKGRISGRFLAIFMFRQRVLSQILCIRRRVVTFVAQEPASQWLLHFTRSRNGQDSGFTNFISDIDFSTFNAAH